MDDAGQHMTRSPSPMATAALVGTCLTLGGIGAIEARHVSVVHGQPLAWAQVLATTMPRWLLLAASLPFVLHLAVRVPLVPWRARVVLAHGVAFLTLSIGQAAADAWAMGELSPAVRIMFSWTARVTRSWYNTLPTIVSAYVAVLVTAWGIGEARERQRRTLRASQLEAQLQRARLDALRAQLQPHFLYNTLTGIAALVADVQPARAVSAIEQLGELLHASLRDDGRETITVAEEVSLTEQYLALQTLRFGERLHHERVIDPAAADCLVPVLLLQPLVENAVVHGLDSHAGAVCVTVRAVVQGAQVVLTVENDGSTLETARAPAGNGVGLAATRARLMTAYGDDASLQLQPREGGGVVVRISLPVVRPALPHRTATRVPVEVA